MEMMWTVTEMRLRVYQVNMDPPLQQQQQVT